MTNFIPSQMHNVRIFHLQSNEMKARYSCLWDLIILYMDKCLCMIYSSIRDNLAR